MGDASGETVDEISIRKGKRVFEQGSLYLFPNPRGEREFDHVSETVSRFVADERQREIRETSVRENAAARGRAVYHLTERFGSEKHGDRPDSVQDSIEQHPLEFLRKRVPYVLEGRVSHKCKI